MLSFLQTLKTWLSILGPLLGALVISIIWILSIQTSVTANTEKVKKIPILETIMHRQQTLMEKLDNQSAEVEIRHRREDQMRAIECSRSGRPDHECIGN